MTQQTDQQLMQLICEGNEEAFTELYYRYAGNLVQLLTRMLHDPSRAEDIIHDTFLRLIEKPNQYDQVQPFKPWIYSVVMNRCRNEIRNNNNRQRIKEDKLKPNLQEVNGSSVLNKLAQDDFDHAYKFMYSQCKPDQRELLTLRFQQELSVKEIAIIMDIPEGTVKSRLFHLLRRFSKSLEPYNPLN